MSELIEVKVRPVGNALGVILPGQIIREDKIKAGETIFLSVLKKPKIKINEVFRSIKGAKPFEREHNDRVI